ncbi:Uncharacterised protein [Mycobacteroides abscessus subsp. abscessus]|nr:Uncharacterised protein [Mycobacteroides abscessus subsp. abscessus]
MNLSMIKQKSLIFMLISKVTDSCSNSLWLTKNCPMIGSQLYTLKIIYPAWHFINQFSTHKLIIFQDNGLHRANCITLSRLQ